jgi:hypothetical protein
MEGGNMLATSDPIAPGETATLFVLVPHSDPRLELKPVAVWMDPPTAAAFEGPLRVDVLTAGETVDLCGVIAASVRLVVRNKNGAEAARFRAEIQLAPDLSRMERDLGDLVERAWRQGRDSPEHAQFDANDEEALRPNGAGRVWFKAP